MLSYNPSNVWRSDLAAVRQPSYSGHARRVVRFRRDPNAYFRSVGGSLTQASFAGLAYNFRIALVSVAL